MTTSGVIKIESGEPSEDLETGRPLSRLGRLQAQCTAAVWLGLNPRGSHRGGGHRSAGSSLWHLAACLRAEALAPMRATRWSRCCAVFITVSRSNVASKTLGDPGERRTARLCRTKNNHIMCEDCTLASTLHSCEYFKPLSIGSGPGAHHDQTGFCSSCVTGISRTGLCYGTGSMPEVRLCTALTGVSGDSCARCLKNKLQFIGQLT